MGWYIPKANYNRFVYSVGYSGQLLSHMSFAGVYVDWYHVARRKLSLVRGKIQYLA